MSADFSPNDTVLAKEDRIGEIAAAWLARRDRGLSEEETRQLAAWLEADARHATELTRLETAWTQCDDGKFDTDLVAMAGLVQTRAAARLRRRNRVRWVGLMAAAAAVALVVTFFKTRNPIVATPEATVAMTYRVMPSEAREIKLADGSVINLRGDSKVLTEFTPSARHVRLLRGEAHFIVAKDSKRPFTVVLGSVAVRAVGTAFNLQLNPTSVEVLVTEGKVWVNDSIHGHSLLTTGTDPQAVLSAGHRASIDIQAGAPALAEVEAVSPGAIERVLAWETVQLVFNRTPLRDAVEAFNHYNLCRLALGAPGLGDRMLGGTCRANNVNGFVRLLEKTAEVRAERRGANAIVLWPAP